MEPIYEVPVTVNAHNSLLKWLAKRTAASGTARKPGRRYPTVAFVSLLLVLLSAGSGIALYAVIVRLKLQTKGDTASRMLLLVASCMSVAYTGLHIAASRTYARDYHHSVPWVHGEHISMTALLLSRLTIPVWIAATVTAAVVSARRGIDTTKGLGANIVWLTLLVCVLALLPSVAVQFAIESSGRPFTTGDASHPFFTQRRAQSSMSGLLLNPVEALKEPVVEVMEARPEKGARARAYAHAHARSKSQPVATGLSVHPPPLPANASRRWSAFPTPKFRWISVDPSRRCAHHLSALGCVASASNDDARSLAVKRISYASTVSSYLSLPSRRTTVEVRTSDLSLARWSTYGVATLADAMFTHVAKPMAQSRSAPLPPPAAGETGLRHPQRRRPAPPAPLATNFSWQQAAAAASSNTPVSGGGGPIGWPLTPQMWGPPSEDGESAGGGSTPQQRRGPSEDELAALEALEAEMGTLGLLPAPTGTGFRNTFGME